jgi:ribosomal protein S18 acetylase RimI-like enzyme
VQGVWGRHLVPQSGFGGNAPKSFNPCLYSKQALLAGNTRSVVYISFLPQSIQPMEISLIIRPYQPQDEPDVIDLWDRCNLVVPWNDPQQDIWRKLQVQPELFLVGLLENQIVATIMAGYDGHRGWLNYLAVAPQHQQQGLGRSMVAAATAQLKAMNCPKINLQIRSSNPNVIEFYQRLGFKVDDVISMGKRL